MGKIKKNKFKLKEGNESKPKADTKDIVPSVEKPESKKETEETKNEWVKPILRSLSDADHKQISPDFYLADQADEHNNHKFLYYVRVIDSVTKISF